MKHSFAFKSRWKPKWTTPENHNIETYFLTALHFVDNPAESKDSLIAGGTLTMKGIVEGYRADMAAKIGRLKSQISLVKRQRADIAQKRSQLGKVEFDKTDAAGAARRVEMRQYLRTLSQADQSALLLGPESREFAEALFETSLALSGIKQPELINRIRDKYVADKHGAELAELNSRDEMLELIEVTQASAVNAIKTEARYATRKDTVAYSSPIETDSWFDGIAEA